MRSTVLIPGCSHVLRAMAMHIVITEGFRKCTLRDEYGGVCEILDAPKFVYAAQYAWFSELHGTFPRPIAALHSEFVKHALQSLRIPPITAPETAKEDTPWLSSLDNRSATLTQSTGGCTGQPFGLSSPPWKGQGCGFMFSAAQLKVLCRRVAK